MKIEIESEVMEEMIDIIESSQGGSADDVLEYRQVLEAAIKKAKTPPDDWSPEC